MAAARAVVEERRAVFLLPYRALVNEKYEQFDALYGAAGMRVIRCTGDYSDQTETNLRQPSQSSKLLMSPMTAESTMSCGAMPRSRAVMRSVSSNSTLMPLPGSVTNWASSRTIIPNWLRTTAELRDRQVKEHLGIIRALLLPSNATWCISSMLCGPAARHFKSRA